MAKNLPHDCLRCHGRGKVSETRTEQDTTMSIVMGAAIGSGYFPMTKQITEDVNCPLCGGSGKQRL